MRELPLCRIALVLGDENVASNAINKSLDIYMSMVPAEFDIKDRRTMKNFLYFWASNMYENQSKIEDPLKHSKWEEYSLSASFPRYKLRAQLTISVPEAPSHP